MSSLLVENAAPATPASTSAPLSFAALFERHYGLLRRFALRHRAPGFLLACEGRSGAPPLVCHLSADGGSLGEVLSLGTHRDNTVMLSGAELAPWHALVHVGRDGRGRAQARVISLAEPPALLHSLGNAAASAEASYFTVGSYALMLLPVGEHTVWPARLDEAWRLFAGSPDAEVTAPARGKTVGTLAISGDSLARLLALDDAALAAGIVLDSAVVGLSPAGTPPILIAEHDGKVQARCVGAGRPGTTTGAVLLDDDGRLELAPGCSLRWQRHATGAARARGERRPRRGHGR